jgi:hypothetical protein
MVDIRSLRLVVAVVILVGSAVSGVAAGASGVSWSIVASPNTSPSHENRLLGVACPGPSMCVAVGDYRDSGDQEKPLIESWDGSVWSIVPSPNTSPTDNDVLTGVSCVGPSSCTAVGYYLPTRASTFQTLIESWNGTTWSIRPSPNPSATDNNFLNGVSCSGPTFCIAVGTDSHPTGGEQTLIESWNGATWSIVPSPNTDVDNALFGVSCAGPAACMAVGRHDFPGPHPLQTLIESWDGATWAVVPSPNTSSTDTNVLNGVSCRDAACMTVGWSFPGAGPTARTLIESWNGSVWSIVPSPNVFGAVLNVLNGVSCSAALSCTAVGSDSSTNRGAGCPFSPCNTLTESWDGSTWSIDSSPNPSSTNINELNAVSCAASSVCTAVGDYNAGGPELQTLIETSSTSLSAPGNIFATTFKDCTILHVGYNRFVNGTVVHWRVTTNGVGTVASGQFSAIGGGNLGSKTYHFLDIALGTTLPSEASGIQSHVLYTWANGGRYYATRDPGC